ncbi:hypothetical protein E3N88_35770 [Mikania micrantha]|uniref:CCHC-type domain-containing protein n=1 Tax=Mikania micrantha TaxID=192012 RepID=A0A5N6M1U6_9ASTR|nr:hypothetical protein E3N88_35770 [Mikania micrantha]
MDINYQMAMISYRAKKFYQRTGRQFKKHNMKTGFGLDKSKLKCFNCQQLCHFSRECKSTGSQPSNSGQSQQRPSSSTNNANIAEQDFADWSFQAEDASISNSALIANDSTSSFKVTDDMCTPECLEKLNVFKRINSQVSNELESLQVVKANFFECERNYKQKIEEMEKTISSLKHEDTNKQCQINNLLERLTTAKTELVLAESYRDKFLSQGEKYEKLFRMSSTTELVNKNGAGLGYNKVEPPSAYTSIMDVRCKPVVNLVYDEELDIHKVTQTENLSDLNPNDYVTCPSDKSKRGRSKERKASFSGKRVNYQGNKSVGASKPSTAVNQSSSSINQNQYQPFLNNQPTCLMCGDKNHFAADCFYNPKSRVFSEKQERGRKKSWRMSSSSSSEEQGRSPVKKVSEASTSDNQNKKASEKNVSEDQERKAYKGKRSSEAHIKKTFYKSKKSFPFGRRGTSEAKPNWSAKAKSSEGKAKSASDDYRKKPILPKILKTKQIWKRKEIAGPSVQSPMPPNNKHIICST